MERATQPRDMKGADDLPEGWECHWSGSLSRYYYFNRVTGESHWYKPRLGSKTEGADDLPEGWECHRSRSHSCFYYFNRVTGESRWCRPSPLKRRRLRSKTKEVSGGRPWDGSVRVTCGRLGMPSRVRGLSKVDLPKGKARPPDCWERQWSRTCRRPYYFNWATGESRWHKPFRPFRRLRSKTEAAVQYLAAGKTRKAFWNAPSLPLKRRRLRGKTGVAALDLQHVRELWRGTSGGSEEAALLRGATWRRFQEACRACASSYPGSGIEIVFHQTREENLDSIAERGLLMGDGVTVPIAHGQKLGNGIYARLVVGPAHKQYGPVTVLCLGLQGCRPQSDTEGVHPLHACSDPFSSTCWRNLIVAYRNGAQLLPLATVTNENLRGVCEAAKRVVAWLETRWPGLQRACMPVAVAAPSARERPSAAGKIGAVLEKASQEPVSVVFAQVLEALQAFKDAMGGAPNLPEGAVSIDGKLPRARLETLTAFEHAAISVLGFARLQQLRYLIMLLDDGTHYQQNLGTQALEQYCGFTMHADRQDASVMLAQGPELLLAAFEAARREGRVDRFFVEAFDRRSDPCLEGRVSLFQEFLQTCALAGPSEEHGVLCQAPGS